jgi:hypothetical protein
MTPRAVGIGSAILMLRRGCEGAQWTNPHIHLLVNVPDGKGGVNEWDIEGGTPGGPRRNGW